MKTELDERIAANLGFIRDTLARSEKLIQEAKLLMGLLHKEIEDEKSCLKKSLTT